MIKFIYIFNYLYYFIVVLSLLYSIYLFYKKKIGYKQKYFFVYLMIVFVTDVLGYFFRKEFGVNYFYFYFPAILLNIIYFGYFYYTEFRIFVLKKIVIALLIFSLIAILLFQYFENTLIISPNAYLIVVFFDLILSLMWFYQIVINIDDVKITNKQSFWVSIGLLLWSIFNLFRLYPINFLFNNDNELGLMLGVITSFINLISYLLFLKGLSCTNINFLRSFNHF